MNKKVGSIILTLFIGLLVCAAPTLGNTDITSSLHDIEPYECQQIPSDGLVKKVDNFMIIFDPSASMTETYLASVTCNNCHAPYNDSDYAEQHAVKYGGREFAAKDKVFNPKRCTECHHDYLYSKFDFARDIAECFNQNIPTLDLSSSLRLFGTPVYTMRSFGPKKYDKKELDHELRKIIDANGASPLDMTLEAVGKDLFDSTGKIAVIVLSDGKDMDQREVLAAEDLKRRYNERICIYTIQIGGDINGKEIMQQIAKAGQCGMEINGDALLDTNTMNNFTKEIFLKKAELPATQETVELPAQDSDGDGVLDESDDCPETRTGLKVDDHGCWKLIVAADILFDFDKYNLKPKGIEILNQVVDFMNKFPFLHLAISGHTDNRGSMEYNIALSKRRALSGFNYLTNNSIGNDRITVSWHSFSIPRATNDTGVGRALNRRLEFNFSKIPDAK